MGGVDGDVYVPAQFQQGLVLQSTNHHPHPSTMQPMNYQCSPPQYQYQHQYPYQHQPPNQQQSPYPTQQYQQHPQYQYPQNQYHYEAVPQQHPGMVIQSTGAPHPQLPVLMVADPSMVCHVQPIYMHPPTMQNASLQSQVPPQQSQYNAGNYNSNTTGSIPTKEMCTGTTTTNSNNTTNAGTSSSATSNNISNDNTNSSDNNGAAGGSSKPSSGPFDCLDDIASNMNTINSHQTSLYSSFANLKKSFLALANGFGAILSSCPKI
jgi:hypothetical protein